MTPQHGYRSTRYVHWNMSSKAKHPIRIEVTDTDAVNWPTSRLLRGHVVLPEDEYEPRSLRDKVDGTAEYYNEALIHGMSYGTPPLRWSDVWRDPAVVRVTGWVRTLILLTAGWFIGKYLHFKFP